MQDLERQPVVNENGEVMAMDHLLKIYMQPAVAAIARKMEKDLLELAEAYVRTNE